MAGAKEPFAKVAAALDANRKIRRAGRDGRDVYLWVLRQVAQRDSDGEIPADDLQDAEYLAWQLMCSEDEARAGVARAVDARLISFDGGVCMVVGWNEEWGRRPLTPAQRAARYRQNHRDTPENSSGADSASRTESDRHFDSDASRRRGEESRGEKKRGEETRAATPALAPLALELESPGTAKRRAPKVRAPAPPAVETSLPEDWTPTAEHVARARTSGLDIAREADLFRAKCADKQRTSASWNGAFTTWLIKAPDFARGMSPTANHSAARPPRKILTA